MNTQRQRELRPRTFIVANPHQTHFTLDKTRFNQATSRRHRIFFVSTQQSSKYNVSSAASDETQFLFLLLTSSELVFTSLFSVSSCYHHDVSLAFQASPASRAML